MDTVNEVGVCSEHFQCFCYSEEHTLKFDLDLWVDGDTDVVASTFLFERPFWERIWIALKYIFGYKCKYGHWDNFIMKPNDYDKFIDLIQKAKEINSLRYLEHKGYKGKVKFDINNKLWHGKVTNCGADDIIVFQGTTPQEVKNSFENSVDDYLKFSGKHIEIDIIKLPDNRM